MLSTKTFLCTKKRGGFGLGGSLGALALSFSLAASVSAAPLTIYVAAQGGSWSRTRLQASNPATPYPTITRAAQIAEPGDTIEVAPGTYYEDLGIINKDHLLIRGKVGAAKPIIRGSASNDYAVAKISGSNNITFTGFEIDGTGTGKNAGGMSIVPRDNRSTGGGITPNHHITVSNCKVHDTGGGGIGSNYDETRTVGNDYINIIGNEVYRTNLTGKDRGSAISLHEDENMNPSDKGYHSVIQNNKVYDNVNGNRDLDSQGNVNLFLHTDGNGIIIDTMQGGSHDSSPVLIQNNIVYRNGGRGIHVFFSSNVDVLNNTVCENDLDPYLQQEGGGSGGGELTVVSAWNVLVSNNVVQGNGKGPAFLVSKVKGNDTLYGNKNIYFRNNTYTKTYATRTDDATIKAETAAALDWTTTIYSDPAWGNLFYNATPSNLSLADYRLNLLATRSGLSSLQSQTARNRGSNALGDFSYYDIVGVSRRGNPVGTTPPGGYIDRGAYEQ